MSRSSVAEARELALTIDAAAQRRSRGEQTGFRLLANQHEDAVNLALQAYVTAGDDPIAATSLVFALARYDEAAGLAFDAGFTNPFADRNPEMARMYAEEQRRFRYSANPREAGEPATITIQEAWEAAGGNPGIKATKQDLLEALKSMDEAIDEVDACSRQSDDELRAEWRAAGGEIHGPNVETVSMPESQYFALRRRLGPAAAHAAGRDALNAPVAADESEPEGMRP